LSIVGLVCASKAVPMICPSCGLLNPPLVKACVGCRGALSSSQLSKPIDLDSVLEKKRRTGRGSNSDVAVSSSPQAPTSKDTRQKQVHIHDGEKEESRTFLKNFLDQDFVKTERPKLSMPTGSSSHQERPLVQRIPVNLKHFSGKSLNTRSYVDPTTPLQTIKGTADIPDVTRRHAPPLAKKKQRIEIDLNQPGLPFDIPEATATSWTDPIRQDLRSAILWDRGNAAIIDAFFILGCCLIFTLIVVFVPDFQFLPRSALLGLGTAFLTISLAYLFLFTLLSAQTLGMEYTELTVVRFDGEAPSLGDVTVRTFGYCISTGCFGLGFLWAFFDPEGLTWHDRISKTLVVQTRTLSNN